MYHAIVRRQVRILFDWINQHEYDRVAAVCRPDVYHRFGGDHALGGERHDREAFSRWLDRLGRLAPQMRLTVHDVWVKGWPHDTTAIVRWTNEAPGVGGGTYRNHGVHVVRLKWGKAVSIDANEDSQAVVELLDQLAAAGVDEAAAAPITS